MIVVKNLYFGIPVYQKWFVETIKFLDCFKILVYKQTKIDSSIGFIKKRMYTLISDLTISDAEIFVKFNATVKNEINRSIRENVMFNSNENIETFLFMYNEFAVYRGLNQISKKKLINLLGNKQLAITSCSIDGVVVAVHSYLLDLQLRKVRLLHSGTIRLNEGVNRAQVARANKYLHYKDMMKFKNDQFILYDWGGVTVNSELESLKGINKFKESFGGLLIQENEYQSFLYFTLSKFI